jgi:hypothetical protein
VFDAAIPKVCGNRQAKRACANDKHVTDSHKVVPFHRMCAQLLYGNFPLILPFRRSSRGNAEDNQKQTHDKRLPK